MTYLNELSKEFDYLRDSVQYSFAKTVVKKSKSAKLAKLRRYIGRVRGEHVPNQKWLTEVFGGRANRTPWKCKGLTYVSKAIRKARRDQWVSAMRKVVERLNRKV